MTALKQQGRCTRSAIINGRRTFVELLRFVEVQPIVEFTDGSFTPEHCREPLQSPHLMAGRG